MTKIISVFLLFLTLHSFSQGYQALTPVQQKDVLYQISQASAKINTLECKFTQKKSISVLSETVVSQGIMYFKKDNHLRWQYNSPYQYLFILSAGKVMIKSENKTEKYDTDKNRIFKEISEIMLGGVSGKMLVDDKKFKAEFSGNSSSIKVVLYPKNKDLQKLMKTITLTFSKKDWTVNSIEMLEKGGDSTLITFTEKNVNKAVSDDLFRIN